MSPRQAMAEPLQVWHLVIGIVIALVSAGASFGASQANTAHLRRDVDELRAERAATQRNVARIDRNVVKIGQALGVTLETE